jgi:hypothetical protein
MTGTPSTTVSDPHYIAKLLEDKKVHKVAIIDDADDPRSESEFYANEIPDFWSEIDLNNENAREELSGLIREKLNREIRRAKDIDDDVLQLLWSSRAGMRELKTPVEEILFSKIIEKKGQLDRFHDHLETQLNLKVFREGTNIDVEEVLKDVSIVFIDYVLGPETELKESIERAEKIASRIYAAYSSGEMPLIILMSSDERAAADEERFRDKSGLLKGMFHFTPKSDLGSRDRLVLSIAAWAKTLPTTVDIQRFIKTLEESMFLVFREFITGVKSLGLEDYAYIQYLSLQEDGHPLGDYMLWLYNSYLGHLLFESRKAVQEQQKVVDGLENNYLPPSQTMPSGQLVKMYQSALFNMNVGDLSAHPVIAAVAESGEGVQTPNDLMPYVHLGDLFIKDGDDHVLMVINAECDLAFGPKRKCDIDGVVLFVPGELQPPEKWGEAAGQTRTEFFEYENRRYRIVWDIKKAFSYQHRDINSQLADKGYKRRARLRLPFALEVQRAFAANLTRIGMPVAPPIYHPVRVEVLAKGEDGKPVTLINPQDDLAFWILTKSDNKYEKHFFLTVEFGQLLKGAVGEYITGLERVRNGIIGDDEVALKKTERLGKKIEGLNACKGNFESWFLELKSIALPGKEATPLYPDFIVLAKGRSIDNPYRESQPILINIIESGEQEPAETSKSLPGGTSDQPSQGEQ